MKKLIFIVLVLFVISNSCTVKYGLTGASIAPDVKTYSVQNFINRAPLAPATIEPYITDELKDRFKSQTSLTIVEDDGHLNFEGEITAYSTKPMAITGNEVASQNRLTITVKVRFTNEIEPQYNFESNFSQFEDYDSNRDLSDVEQDLIELIVEKLIEDIFNKSVVNW